MVDFRKCLPAFAIAALAIGASSANAQVLGSTAFQCTAAATPQTVRAEGITELVGDIILTCSGGRPTPAGQAVPVYNITVALNTNITSRILDANAIGSPQGATSEALLLIDEPTVAAGAGFNAANPGVTNAGNLVVCNSTNTATCNATPLQGVAGQPGPTVAGTSTTQNGITYNPVLYALANGVTPTSTPPPNSYGFNNLGNTAANTNPATQTNPLNSFQAVNAQGQPTVAQQTVYNVYPGRINTNGSNLTTIPAATGGSNAVTWYGIPLDPPGSNAVRTIRLTNIRAYAALNGVSTTITPAQIFAYITIGGTAALPVTNPSVVVGLTAQGLITSFRGVNNITGTTGALNSTTGASFLQCINNNPGVLSNSNPIAGITGIVRFTEGFATSFRRRTLNSPPVAAGATGASTGPTVIAAQPFFDRQYNTESGLYIPALTINGNNTAGLADTGTRFIIRVFNLQAGVTLYSTQFEISNPAGSNGAGSTAPTTPGTGTTSRVVRVLTDQNGAGCTFSNGSFTTAACFTLGSVASSNVQTPTASGAAGAFVNVPVVAFQTASGTNYQWATYEVVYSDPTLIETIEVGIVAQSAFNPTSNLPGTTGPATVSASFAPLSTVTVADATSPIPRFVISPSTSPFLTINACATNLLFPFVTNQAGYETGIAIANTSLDPFGTPGQTGTCKINYYGTTTGGGTAPNAQTTTANIAPGQTLTFLLGGGASNINVGGATATTAGINGTPGFQGYLIAQCGFQFAHGFAFILGPGGATAEGYLALVMDTPFPFNRTPNFGEALNQ